MIYSSPVSLCRAKPYVLAQITDSSALLHQQRALPCAFTRCRAGVLHGTKAEEAACSPHPSGDTRMPPCICSTTGALGLCCATVHLLLTDSRHRACTAPSKKQRSSCNLTLLLPTPLLPMEQRATVGMSWDFGVLEEPVELHVLVRPCSL